MDEEKKSLTEAKSSGRENMNDHNDAQKNDAVKQSQTAGSEPTQPESEPSDLASADEKKPTASSSLQGKVLPVDIHERLQDFSDLVGSFTSANDQDEKVKEKKAIEKTAVAGRSMSESHVAASSTSDKDASVATGSSGTPSQSPLNYQTTVPGAFRHTRGSGNRPARVVDARQEPPSEDEFDLMQQQSDVEKGGAVVSSATSQPNEAVTSLVAAELVEETVLATAEPADDAARNSGSVDPLGPVKDPKSWWKFWAVLAAVIIIVALAVGLSVGLTTRNNNEPPPFVPPPRPPGAGRPPGNGTMLPPPFANLTEQDGNSTESIQARISVVYGVVWGSLAEDCEGVDPPIMHLNCPQEGAFLLQSTKGADCSRLGNIGAVCTISADLSDQHPSAAILFACLGGTVTDLIPTLRVDATVAENCTVNANDAHGEDEGTEYNSTGELLHDASGGWPVSFLYAVHFCPADSEDSVAPGSFVSSPVTNWTTHSLLQCQDQIVFTDAAGNGTATVFAEQEICHTVGTCISGDANNTDNGSVFCSEVEVDVVTIDLGRPADACVNIIGLGPSVAEQWSLIEPILDSHQ